MRGYAFSLIELIIVLVIIGVVALFAVSGYQGYIERMRAKNAEANLLAIYDKQKRYKLDNGNYYACATATTSCTLDDINANLNLDLTDSYFSYSIEQVGHSGYRAAARRNANSSLCSGQTMTLTEANSDITKNCNYWK